MIDEKKIEEAAAYYAEENTTSVEDQWGDMITDTEELSEAYKEGANWAVNEFLKDLWHPAEEEPKYDKRITYVCGNGISKTIILNEEADKFNRTPSQIWNNICKNYKVACWLYIDDLFPKEGGEK